MQMNNLLNKKIILNKKNLDYKKSLNIAYGIDNNFIRPMGVSMTSIIENNKDINIIFHIFISEISKDNLTILKNFADIYNITLIIYIINTDFIKELSYTEYFSKAMYNRFIMPIILKDVIDKLIYIDADIQCFGSLKELINIDFNNNIVAVVNDIKIVRNRQIKALQLKNNKYFNSGFIYIDINKWNEHDISNKVIKLSLKNKDKFNWQDQDALNIILDGKCKYLDKKYDYLVDLKHKNINILKNVIFIHYVGRYKPWNEWCLNPLRHKFLNVEKRSLWKNMPLIKIKNYKQMKLMGYAMFQYGNYLKSIYWYLKYSIHKIIKKIGMQ